MLCEAPSKKNEDPGRPKPSGVSRRGKKHREITRFRRSASLRGAPTFCQHATRSAWQHPRHDGGNRNAIRSPVPCHDKETSPRHQFRPSPPYYTPRVLPRFKLIRRFFIGRIAPTARTARKAPFALSFKKIRQFLTARRPYRLDESLHRRRNRQSGVE